MLSGRSSMPAKAGRDVVIADYREARRGGLTSSQAMHGTNVRCMASDATFALARPRRPACRNTCGAYLSA